VTQEKPSFKRESTLCVRGADKAPIYLRSHHQEHPLIARYVLKERHSVREVMKLAQRLDSGEKVIWPIYFCHVCVVIVALAFSSTHSTRTFLRKDTSPQEIVRRATMEPCAQLVCRVMPPSLNTLAPNAVIELQIS
jgi:hypothetical protein